MLELISVLVIWKNDDSWGEEKQEKALSPVIYGQLKSSLMWREDEEAATILQHVINSRRVWTQNSEIARHIMNAKMSFKLCNV